MPLLGHIAGVPAEELLIGAAPFLLIAGGLAIGRARELLRRARILARRG